VGVGVRIIDKSAVPGLLLVCLLITASFWRVSGQIYNPDFLGYVWLLEEWQETGFLPRPHLLYPFSVIVVNGFLPGNRLELASRLVAVLYSVLHVAVLYVVFWRRLSPTNPTARWRWAVIFSLSLFVVTPLTFTINWDNWVLGYMAMTHNGPPMIVLRPFLIPAFLLTLTLFQDDSQRIGRQNLLLLAAFSIIASMTKPNYLLAMLPTVGLFALFRLVRRQSLKWADTIWGIFIPSVIILAVQYVMVYVTDIATLENQSPSQLAIMPFEVFRLHAEVTNPFSDRFLFLKFVASLLFPLVVYVAYFQKARRSLMFNVAWVFFLINAFFNYMVVETGDTIRQWNGQIGFTVFFAVATLFLIQENRDDLTQRLSASGSVRLYIALLVFTLHVSIGMMWYVAHFGERFKYMY
jgi:hypothetical protein